MKSGETRLTCSGLCSRKAVRFGQFAGGLCDDHALRLVRDDPSAINQFWPEHRDAIRGLHREEG